MPNFAEVKLFTTPEPFAREGGKNEAAGSILLNVSGMLIDLADQAIQADGATIMLHFSVPLAADIDRSQPKAYQRQSDGNRRPYCRSDGDGGER